MVLWVLRVKLELFPGRPGGSSSGAKKTPRTCRSFWCHPSKWTKWAMSLHIHDNEMGSRWKPFGPSSFSTDLCFFRELLNWIHEQDLCFFLNRLYKLLTKVGPPQIALAWIRTPLVEEAATTMLPPKDEISTQSQVKWLRRVHNPLLLLLLQLVEYFGLLGAF